MVTYKNRPLASYKIERLRAGGSKLQRGCCAPMQLCRLNASLIMECVYVLCSRTIVRTSRDEMADSYTVVQNSCTLECEWNDIDNGIIVFIYWTSYFFLSCAYHKIPVQSLPAPCCACYCLVIDLMPHESS